MDGDLKRKTPLGRLERGLEDNDELRYRKLQRTTLISYLVICHLVAQYLSTCLCVADGVNVLA